MHSFPVNGVQFLLGNDLAGDKVVVNPLVTANPSLDQIDPFEIPELYPGCAVTRALAKKFFQMRLRFLCLTPLWVICLRLLQRLLMIKLIIFQ